MYGQITIHCKQTSTWHEQNPHICRGLHDERLAVRSQWHECREKTGPVVAFVGG